MSTQNYDDYSAWKKSLGQKEFFSLSDEERGAYASQFLSSKVPYSNLRALEIGFGHGSLLRFLSENNSKVEGVEIQQGLIEAASKKGIKVYNSIDQVSGEYDLIIAMDVLEHMSIEQIKQFFSCCSKLLKKDGYMLFRFPNADSYAGMPAQNGDYTHVTAIGISKFWHLINPYPFELISFGAAVTYPKRMFHDILRGFTRFFFVKLTGVGNPYFFSANVIAVVKFDARKTLATQASDNLDVICSPN